MMDNERYFQYQRHLNEELSKVTEELLTESEESPEKNTARSSRSTRKRSAGLSHLGSNGSVHKILPVCIPRCFLI